MADQGILTASAPAFDRETVEKIAADVFGKSGQASEMGGERDQNVRIETADGRGYVLKISNPAERVGAIDLQTEAYRHVYRTAPDLPVMEFVPTLDGEPWTTVDGPGGESHFVRLFTIVPGETVSPSSFDHDDLFEYGQTVARMGRALQGFFHPEADYEILWDLQNTPRLRTHLNAIAMPERRALAGDVIDRFEDRVSPSFDALRAQVIHNDLTVSNVLFDDANRVSGIIDFGDLTHTALVSDLAIALASGMFHREDPIAAAQSMIRGYVNVTPLQDDEIQILADLVAARLVAWGTIAAWRVQKHPENAEYITGDTDEAWAVLTTMADVGWDEVGRRFRTAATASRVPYSQMETDALASRRRDVLGSSPLSYRDPVHIVSGEGVWLYDRSGERYLDAYNNVQSVGHANPEVAAAIADQAHTLATNTRYLHESAVELADRLETTMPGDLDTTLFVNSGSEATDLAWRLAAAATGHRGAIVTTHAYHGVTESATELSPEVWPGEYRPDRVETVPPPLAGDSDWSDVTDDAIAALDERGHGTAAAFVDTLFTSDGIHAPTATDIGGLTARIREGGGLLVADEVQAGFGRTGADLWGFADAGVVPDIVTLGKPMGNGHPVAAVVTRREIADALMDDTYVFSTFGGNPVSCAAGLATLDVIEDRDLLEHVADVGSHLRDRLTDVAADSDTVAAVRGTGLMVGVELVQDGGEPATEVAADVVNALRQRGVLIGSTGVHENVLKIRPPLVFEREHAERVVEELAAVL